MFPKIKNSILIIILVTICPEIINKFILPLDPIKRIGFFSIGLAMIINIFLQGIDEANKINQVLEAKNIEINGFKPKLIKQKQIMTDD